MFKRTLFFALMVSVCLCVSGFVLPVQGAADKPTASTSSAGSIGESSATLYGSVDTNGGAEITGYGFKWGTSSSVSDGKEYVGWNNFKGSFSYNVSGLQPGTTYYFQAFAQNSQGAGYGSVMSFTTSAPAKPPADKPSVNTDSVGNVGTNSARLYGSIAYNGGASITAYGFKWGTSSSASGSKEYVGWSDLNGSFYLDINGLQPGTTYYYKAFAQNSEGSSYGSVMSFTTQNNGPPPVGKPTANTNSASVNGSSATLYGSVSSDEAPSNFGFKWGTSAGSLSNKAYGYGLSGATSGSFSGDLSGLSPGTTYYYQAFAQNSAGTGYGATLSFTVPPKNTPPPVGKPTANTTSANVNGSSATLYGSVSSDEAPSNFGFKWGTSAGSLSNKAYGYGLSGATSGSFSGDLSGLSPGTTYYYQAFAQNSAGTGYGATLSFTVPPKNTPPPVGKPTANTTSASVNGSSATLCGSVSSDEAPSNFGFKWGTSAGSLSNKAYGYGLSGAASGSFSGDLSGLSPGTTYYYQAFAQNSAGTGYGATLSFTVPPKNPPPPVGKPTANTTSASVNGSSATLYGSVSSDEAPSNFGFKWGTSAGSLSNKAYGYGLSGATSGSFSGDLSGLSPGTTYYYQAFAQNSAGTGYGSTLSFTTPPKNTPPPVGKPTANTTSASVNGSSATLYGSVSSDEAPSNFGFKWGTSAGSLSNKAYGYGLSGAASGSFSGDLSGLSPGTTYYYQAFAQNSAGTGYGATLSFTVPPKNTPPPVGKPTANTTSASVNGTSATLYGSMSSDEAPSNFGFKWGTSAGSLSNKAYGYGLSGATSGSFSGDLSGLSPGTTYYYQAFIQNSTGVYYGDTLSFKIGVSVQNQAPEVSISSPSSNGLKIKTGEKVQIEATATDDVKVVAMGLYIFNGSQTVYNDRFNAGSVSYTWNTAGLPSGLYTIKVTAWDGQKSDEDNIITVAIGDAPIGPVAIGDISINGKVYSGQSLCEGYVGNKFEFNANVSGSPASVVIQFDNGDGSTIMKNGMTMSKNSASASDGSSVYGFSLKVNTPGPAKSYKRKVKITAGDVSKEAFFVVRPNEAPAINTISINGKVINKDGERFPVGTLSIEATASGNALAMNLYKLVNGESVKLIREQVQGNKLSEKVPFTSSGEYTLRFTSVNGENETIPRDIIIVVGNPKPLITSVDPMSGDSKTGITLTIKGKGFIGLTDKVEVVTLAPEDSSGTKYSTTSSGNNKIKILSVSGDTVTASLPKAMEDGDYTVWIAKNWSGSESQYVDKNGQKQVFKVQSDSKPKITSVSPLSTDSFGTTAIVLEGSGFKGLYSGIDTLTLAPVDPAGIKYSTGNIGETQITDLKITDTRITAMLPSGMKRGDYTVWVSKNSAGEKMATCYEKDGKKVIFKVDLLVIPVPRIYVYPVCRQNRPGLEITQILTDFEPLGTVYAGDLVKFRVKLDKDSENANVAAILDDKFRIEMPYKSSDPFDGQRLYEKIFAVNSPGSESEDYMRAVKIEVARDGKSEYISKNSYDGKSLDIKVMPDELRPLRTPELTVTKFNNKGIELSWNSVHGASYYILERSTDEDFKQNLQVFKVPDSGQNTMNYSDSSVVMGEIYGYRVKATGDNPDSQYSKTAIGFASDRDTMVSFWNRSIQKTDSDSPAINWLTNSFIIDSFAAQKSGSGWTIDMNVFNRSLQMTEMSCDALVIVKGKTGNIKGIYPVSGISTPGGTFEEIYEGMSTIVKSGYDNYEFGDAREQMGHAKLTQIKGLKVETGDTILITKTDPAAIGLSTYTLVKAIWGMKDNELFTKSDKEEQRFIQKLSEKVCKDGVKQLAKAWLNDKYISIDEIPEVGQIFVDVAIQSIPGELQNLFTKRLEKELAPKNVVKTLALRELIMQVARSTGDIQELLRLISDPALANQDITISVPNPNLYEN